MADVSNARINWGGTPEAALVNFEPVVQAGKTFKVGPIGGELYDANRKAVQEEQLGNQAIAKGKQDLAKGKQESTVLKNTMAVLGDDATEFDIQSAKQYAATFGTVPIDPKTGRIDKITMHGNLEMYNRLRINAELAKVSNAGFKSEKTTKEIDGRIYDVMVHLNAQGQVVGQTVLSEKRKSVAELEGSQQKELSGYTTILGSLDEFEKTTNENAKKVQAVVGTGKIGTLLFPVGGKIQEYNIWDKDATKQQAMSKAILSEISRTLGSEVGNMSDSDIARWAKSVPQSYTPPEVSKHLFETLRKRVRRSALDKLELLDSGGFAMSQKASQLFGVTPEKWKSYVQEAREGKRGLEFLTGEKEDMPPASPGGSKDSTPTRPGVYLRQGKVVTVGADGSETEEAPTVTRAASPVAMVTPAAEDRANAGLLTMASLGNPISYVREAVGGGFGQNVVQPALNAELPSWTTGLGRGIVNFIRPAYEAVTGTKTAPSLLSAVPVQLRQNQGYPPPPPPPAPNPQGPPLDPQMLLPQVPILPVPPQGSGYSYPFNQFLNY